MRKNLLVTALILLASISFVFAATTDNFTVTTEVERIDVMTVSKTAYSGTTLSSFNTLDPFTNLAITSGGEQTFDAWLTTLSNNRAGFTVRMKATAMNSSISGQSDSYINYTVSCGDASITTNDGTEVIATNTVVSRNALTEVTSTSNKISLSINQNDFEKALSGVYQGVVTFMYQAH